MNLTLTDRMPFGKHKGKTLEVLLKENPGYLVWLREERKKNQKDERFFSAQMSALLDTEILKSKSLRREYKPWNLSLPTQVSIATPTEREPELSYDGYWGAM